MHERINQARAFLAVQAVGGALWWVSVFASGTVRSWTLGAWDPAVLVVPDLFLFAGASAMAAVTGSRFWSALVAAWTIIVTVALVAYALVTREAGWGAVLMVLATVGTGASALTLWFGRLPVQWFFVGPFAFHSARERTPARHVRQSLGQLVVFWTTFLLALPVVLSWAETRLRVDSSALERSGWRSVGAAVFLAASALGLWSCFTMALRGEGTPLPAATARRLVMSGPYRFVRNPMAVAGAFQTIGAGLWLGSWMVLVSALAGALIWDTIIRPSEEADLAVRFGDDYDAYRRHVRCWIPALPPARH